MKHVGWVHIKYLIDFAALFFLYTFVFFKKWKNRGRDVLTVNTLMYIYLSFVLFFTLMPMNLIPFVDILMGRGDFIRQIALNIMMTIPFGFLLPLTDNRTAKFSKTIFFCFLMSLGIELLQPLIDGSRSSDVTDLITNVIGGILGHGFYVVFRPVTFWILDRLKKRD